MTDRDLSKALADLGARIDARIDEMKRCGEFRDVHAAAFADVEARRTRLETRMENLVASGDYAGAAGLELRRDVDALVDGFEAALFDVDARARKA